MPWDDKYTVTLNAYHVANLKAALEAAGIYRGPEPDGLQNPLGALNTGDWLGEIYYKLPTEVDYRPNVPADDMVKRAKQIGMLNADKSKEV